MATRHKQWRFEEFLRRMRDAAPASTSQEARDLLATTLNAVEDAWSGILYDPASWQSDGRMYPPEDDSIRDVPGKPLVKRFRSKGHNTYIGNNGAIEIRTTAGEIIFGKRGADGRGIWDP